MRLRNLRCEAAKVLKRTAEPLMMMMTMTYHVYIIALILLRGQPCSASTNNVTEATPRIQHYINFRLQISENKIPT
jgi:hypothetical protein